MVFFNVTGLEGDQVQVNSETVKYCDGYDHIGSRRGQLAKARIEHPLRDNGAEEAGDFHGIDPSTVTKLRAEFAKLDGLNAVINFVDGSWMAVRETPGQVREIANKAFLALFADQKPEVARAVLPQVAVQPKP